MPLLSGEADGATRQQLEAHLQSCAECAADVQAWQRTLGRLDSWQLPKARRARAFPMQPVAWATAAAVVIGAFVAGRFTAPQFDAKAFRAELKSELSAEIQQGFAHAAQDSATALANLETRLASASVRNQKEMAGQFVEYIAAARLEDRKATDTLWEKLQSQYTTDFVLLRRDLETLASTTDEEIESARAKLFQLASNQITPE